MPLIEPTAVTSTLIPGAPGTGKGEEERKRHELEEKCKRFLQLTNDIAIAAAGYPGGLRALVTAREAAVTLLVQLMRAKGRAT